MHISFWTLSQDLLDVWLLLNFNPIKKNLYNFQETFYHGPMVELKVMLISIKLCIEKNKPISNLNLSNFWRNL
jgi:hypothetical protein